MNPTLYASITSASSQASASSASAAAASSRSAASSISVASSRSAASVASSRSAASVASSRSAASVASYRSAASMASSRSASSVSAAAASSRAAASSKSAAAASHTSTTHTTKPTVTIHSSTIVTTSKTSSSSTKRITTTTKQPTSTLKTSTTVAPANTLHTFRLQGCYAAPTPAPMELHEPHMVDMSLEKCASTCYNDDFFGVQYGTQCWCGPSLNSTAQPVPLAQCFDQPDHAYNCPGSKGELCGGRDGMTIYGRLIAIGSCPQPSVTLGGGSQTCASIIVGPTSA